MIIPGTNVSVYVNLDDIGLFKKRRAHELMSQRERAEQIRDAFAHCMCNALQSGVCIMPGLCANNEPRICAHLTFIESAGHAGQLISKLGQALGTVHLASPNVIDYGNFTGNGIPLTGRARTQIDGRLRAIGTLVHRSEMSSRLGGKDAYAGDVWVPLLDKTTFPAGARRKAGAPKRAVAKPKAKAKSRGWLASLFG